MTNTHQQFLRGLVDPSRVRIVPHHPLVRLPNYRDVPAPAAWREKEALTLVEVESSQETAAILKKANKENLPVYVRQGTGVITADIVRAEPPGSLVLDLRRMHWILPEFDAGYVEVGPTVTEKELNVALDPDGYSYPEFIGPVTWGGLVSINSSGRSVDPYIGKPGDYVLGLEVVLPTGEIIQTGTRAQRKLCGMDLTHLFIGCQSTYGIITGLRLRLAHKPRHIVWATAHLPSLSAVGRTVLQLYRTRAPYPRLLEVMDQRFLGLMGFPKEPPPAMMIVSTDGWTSAEAEEKLEIIFGVMKEQGASNTTAMSPEEWGELYKIREGVHRRLEERGCCYLVGEVLDCPLPSLVSCLEASEQLLRHMESTYPELYTFTLGHIGVGSFHPSIGGPTAWGYERLGAVAKDFRDRLLAIKLEHGASIGEQGVFPQHYQWFQRYHKNQHLPIVRGIKDLLDPNHILNDLRLQPGN